MAEATESIQEIEEVSLLDQTRERMRTGEVGDTERLISTVTGGTILLFGLGLIRRFLGGAGLAAAGGYLLYRGMTGKCPASKVVEDRFTALEQTIQKGKDQAKSNGKGEVETSEA